MADLMHVFNLVLAVLITAAFAYQGVFLLVGLFRRRQTERFDAPEAKKLHRYAAVVSARNEAAVIGELIASLKAQNYPQELLDI